MNITGLCTSLSRTREPDRGIRLYDVVLFHLPSLTPQVLHFDVARLGAIHRCRADPTKTRSITRFEVVRQGRASPSVAVLCVHLSLVFLRVAHGLIALLGHNHNKGIDVSAKVLLRLCYDEETTQNDEILGAP